MVADWAWNAQSLEGENNAGAGEQSQHSWYYRRPKPSKAAIKSSHGQEQGSLLDTPRSFSVYHFQGVLVVWITEINNLNTHTSPGTIIQLLAGRRTVHVKKEDDEVEEGEVVES